MELQMRLPNHYVEIEQEEMMYLEGGWNIYANWWGTSLYLTTSECRTLTYGYTAAGIWAGASALAGPQAVIAIGLAGLCAQIGADNRGLWVNRSWTGQMWVSF